MKDLQYYRVQEWFRQRGDHTLRLDYDLHPNSLVVDAGGYRGDFAAAIHQKYNCHVAVFEPISTYAKTIQERFAGNSKIRVYNVALGTQDRTVDFQLLDDGTSSIRPGSEKVQALEVQTSRKLNEIGARKIDLFKINVEGAEYGIIEDLSSSGWLQYIENIQVQFHDFVDNAEDKLMHCRRLLEATHHQTYCFKYVWENWTINNESSLRLTCSKLGAQVSEVMEKLAILEQRLEEFIESSSVKK